MATGLESDPIVFAKNSAAAGCKHQVIASSGLVDHRLFYVPKRVFALRGKKIADGTTQPFLNLGVGIGKTPVKALGQLAAHRGLAATGHTHKRNRTTENMFGSTKGLLPQHGSSLVRA